MKQNLEFIEVCGLEDYFCDWMTLPKNSWRFNFILFIMFMRGCLCECISNTGFSYRSQKKISDPLELKLQPVIGSLARATSILNFWAISPIPPKSINEIAWFPPVSWSPVTVPKVIPTYWSGLSENKNSKGNYLRPRNSRRVNGLGK